MTIEQPADKPIADKSGTPAHGGGKEGLGAAPAAKVQASKPHTEPGAQDDLKSLPLAEVEKRLGSSPRGLTQVEAQKRLAQYGPNEIEEKKANQLLKLLTYFWGPIPWMIEVAVILSGVLQHWPDFVHHPGPARLPTPASDSRKSARLARPSTP